MHFLRLIRPVNLFIIVLTMVGVKQYMLLFRGSQGFSDTNFWLLVFSTILIAAAGNIINDYFDVRADRVNRPKSVIIGKHIKRRWAIVLHWNFNILAIIIAIYLGWYYQSFLFLIIHFTSISFLWWYSVSLKKKPVVGNLVIATLTVLVIYLAQRFILLNSYESITDSDKTIVNDHIFDIPSIFIIWVFMGMAFVQNFAREIIKDVEDIKGDTVIGAKTIPMLIGNSLTTKLIGILLLLFPLIYFTGILFFFESFNWIDSLPITLAAIVNLIAFIISFLPEEQKAISWMKNLLKLSMFLGILYLFLPQ